MLVFADVVALEHVHGLSTAAVDVAEHDSYLLYLALQTIFEHAVVREARDENRTIFGLWALFPGVACLLSFLGLAPEHPKIKELRERDEQAKRDNAEELIRLRGDDQAQGQQLQVDQQVAGTQEEQANQNTAQSLGERERLDPQHDEGEITTAPAGPSSVPHNVSAEEEEAPLNQEYTDAPTDQQSRRGSKAFSTGSGKGAGSRPTSGLWTPDGTLKRHLSDTVRSARDSIESARLSSPRRGPVTSHSTWSVGLLIKVLKLLAGRILTMIPMRRWEKLASLSIVRRKPRLRFLVRRAAETTLRPGSDHMSGWG